MPPVCFELSFFFTGCNRCLSSAARSQANSGILIIALATGTRLVAAESEPVSYWLPWRTAQSTEFHLMKGSVQQAAARSCSLRVGRGDPAVCHFSLSISYTQIYTITHIKLGFECKTYYLHVNFKKKHILLPRSIMRCRVLFHRCAPLIKTCCLFHIL